MYVFEYFQSFQYYFWQWEENGEILSIPNGSTIAYRAQVLEILDSLTEQGFPPFGALLLAIVATNHTMGNDLELIEKKISEHLIKDSAYDHINSEILIDAVKFLQILQTLPKNYKQGKNRILLLSVLFESCHNITSVKKSQKMLSYFKRQLESNRDGFIHQFNHQEVFNYPIYKKDFQCIALLHKKFPDTNTIIQKITELPNIEETIEEIDEPTTQQLIIKDFVQELIDNDKTFHVGTLIKRIWSGLNIPFHQNLPSEQPLGGISDLTNKGDFDKLLISEFANDDIVFMSRLANNEALYIHREIPPSADKLERILLIDVSLKNWGTPKILAYSILVAIARHPKTDIACVAFILGNNYKEIKFNTVEEITESLQLLDGSLHAAQGLDLFFKEHKPSKNREIFFITSADAYKNAALQKTIHDYYEYFKYWVIVDQHGLIELYKNQQRSKKFIQKIQLPLEELWKKELKKTIEKSDNEDIISSEEYPVLFPFPAYNKQILCLDGNTYVISTNKMLFKTQPKNSNYHNKGLELIIETLPSNITQYEMGKNANGEYILFCFAMQFREIITINLKTKERNNIVFNEWKTHPNPNFFYDAAAFYHIQYKHFWKITASDKIEISQFNKEHDELDKIYENRKQEIKKAENEIYYGNSILKNIDSIFINRNDRLVFNKHNLFENGHGVIKLETIHGGIYLEPVITANKISKDVFEFPDKSTVTIHAGGMLILKSSNISIPAIHIPSIIDRSLGVVCGKYFTGNEYYLSDKNGAILSKIIASKFYNQYIDAYISTILKHGA